MQQGKKENIRMWKRSEILSRKTDKQWKTKQNDGLLNERTEMAGTAIQLRR